MNTNANPDGFMVHPLDLFPTNKNLNHNIEKISTNTANLDGFQVHPIDLFVSNDNPRNNYYLTNNLTVNNTTINNPPQPKNISLVPFVQATNVGALPNNFKNTGNIEVAETQLQPNPRFTPLISANAETHQNNSISYVPFPINNEINPNQTNQNLINPNNINQNQDLANTYNIVNLPNPNILDQSKNMGTLYNNNASPNEFTNQLGKYNQDYNLYAPPTTKINYQNYPPSNAINIITPPNQETLVNKNVNYLPNETSNFNLANPNIPPYSTANLNPINEANKMLSPNITAITPNNSNLNMNITANYNKGIPYSTTSYEPDTNASDYQTRTSFGNLESFINNPPIGPAPQKSLITRRYDVPNVPRRIPRLKTTIIVPKKKTIIIPKKTVVIVPNLRKTIVKVRNNPVIQSQYVPQIVTNNLVTANNNIVLTPLSPSLMPLSNTYTTRTTPGLSRTTSQFLFFR